jgi:hypothetical protein
MLGPVIASSAAQGAASAISPEVELAFKLLAVVGVVLGAVGATIAFFLKRYWDKRDKRQQQEWERKKAEWQAAQDRLLATEGSRDRLRDILYESLRWFEGESQKRSIGISVVDASWDVFPEFRPIWLAVLANQAVYLLIVSEQKDKAHEIMNLARIMRMLVEQKANLDLVALEAVLEALKKRIEKTATSGLWVKDQDLMDWQNALRVGATEKLKSSEGGAR